MANTKSTEEKIKDIVVELTGCDASKLMPDAKFIDDIGVDSLDAVEIIMGVEEEFGVEIPDEAAEKLMTVGALTRYIDERLAKV